MLFSFNRTFMELKCDDDKDAKIAELRFNRTFMELKLMLITKTTRSLRVSIVPLWN